MGAEILSVFCEKYPEIILVALVQLRNKLSELEWDSTATRHLAHRTVTRRRIEVRE